jgi:hypothetical protein
MFSAQERVKHIHVSVKLSDGRALDGRFIISETSDLLRTLNGEGKFAVFVDHEDNHKLIAKSSIVEANEKTISRVKPLDATNDNGFDPYKILGVSPETGFDVIERQYKKLSRSYHPGRYTHAEMPTEIAEYAVARSLLIKQAYQSLTAGAEDVAIAG